MSGNQGKALPHRGSSLCRWCFVPGHEQHNCQACETCWRHGHQKQNCPYTIGGGYCGHCLEPGHVADSCPKLNGREIKCTIHGCNASEPTWLHPHDESDLSAGQRAQIRGTNFSGAGPAQAGRFATIYANGRTVATAPPSCTTATLNYTADTSKMGSHSGHSVVTNYVLVPQTPQVVHEYRIDVVVPPSPQGADSPPISQRSERKRVFNALRHSPVLHGRNDFFTDYDTLWSCSLLDSTQLQTLGLQYTKQSGRMVTLHSVDLVFLRTLNFNNGTTDLVGQALLTGPVAQQRNPNLLIKALNGMVTKCITEGQSANLFEASANSFYIKSGATPLHDSLLINRGYFTSVRPGEDSVLLNVNIMHSTFLKPSLVSAFLRDMNGPGKKIDYGNAELILKGRAVRVTYDRGIINQINYDLEANRKKRIAGFGKVPQLQQFDDGSRMWTVKEWFETQGLRITQLQHPCVNVGLPTGTRSGVGALWIPAEYLEIEPYQMFGRMLSSSHMKVMLQTALRHPAANQAAIVHEGLHFLGVNNQQISNALTTNYNFQIGSQLLQVPAQILTPPSVEYRSSTKSPVTASWDVARDVFAKTNSTLQNSLPLGVLDLRTNTGADAASIGFGVLKRCRDHGILTTPPRTANVTVFVPSTKRCNPNRDSWANFDQAVEKAWVHARKPSFVLVLIDNNDPTLYAAVKWFAEHRAGFKSIVCTNGKIPQMQDGKLKEGNQLLGLFSNLALKFNIKAGGQNHRLVAGGKSAFAALLADRPSPSAGVTFPAKATKFGSSSKVAAQAAASKDPNRTDTMVIGVDVVHPGGDVPSIAAMVGSIDAAFANMPGSIRLQPGRTEILTRSNMRELLHERLSAFKKNNNNALPERILFYRDGVSEEQYYQLLNEEVSVIGEELPTAALTVIVVGKRHNTRFFCANESTSYPDGRGPPSRTGNGKFNGNAKPGLLVDSVITQPATNDGFRDFFLQSHAALRGTAKSAHYIVIRNDDGCKLSMPEIHNLTHAFCYHYARATKGVSYCAPAYYADRLCDRAHKYLKFYMAIYDRGPEHFAKQAGETIPAYRVRYRDCIAGDALWLLPDRASPWMASLDDIMFWL